MGRAGEPEGAGSESVKLQFTIEFELWTVESQLTCVTRKEPCDWTDTAVLREPPLNDAVMVATCGPAFAPAVTVKLAEADPETTRTLAGTVSALLLLVMATLAPLLPAAWVSTSVHVAAAPGASTAGVQAKEAGLKETVTLNEVEIELPPYEAVITAV